MVAKDFFYEGYRRVEIPKKVLLEVWARCLKRAGEDPSKVACEGCGLVLGKKRKEYDHQLCEAFQRLPPAKRPPIRADDVKLLGWECCHVKKSGSEVKALAKTKRLARREAGLPARKNKAPSRWPTGRNSKYKSKIGGGVEER